MQAESGRKSAYGRAADRLQTLYRERWSLNDSHRTLDALPHSNIDYF